MAVTLTQLSAFLSVVRHGSVTAAAEELVVTQPSVSAAVAALERELGLDLTERSGRSVKPTAAGEAYARYAENVLGLLKEGSEVADSISRGAGSQLRIAAVTTAGEHLLPPLIQSFSEHYPDWRVSLHVGNRDDVFHRLSNHLADVAISGRAPEDRGFEAQAFAQNEFVLITSPRDPLARRTWVAVEELGRRPWLIREEGSGTRRLCHVYLAQHQLEPSLLTLGSNGAIKNAARVGLGIALQSRDTVRLELDFGLLGMIHPRGGCPKRTWFVVKSTVGPTREPVEAFIAFVRSPAARQILSSAHGEEVQQTRRKLAATAAPAGASVASSGVAGPPG